MLRALSEVLAYTLASTIDPALGRDGQPQ